MLSSRGNSASRNIIALEPRPAYESDAPPFHSLCHTFAVHVPGEPLLPRYSIGLEQRFN